MEKAHDYIHEFKGIGGCPAKCRIRVYEDGVGVPVVICTELEDNPGTSITNAAEMIAAEVIEKHPIFQGYHEMEPPFVWIEHYLTGASGSKEDPHTFDYVTFKHYKVEDQLGGGLWHKEIGQPDWKYLERQEVERMIGQAVD